MLKKILLISSISVCAINLVGCVANKTVTEGGTLLPPDANSLNASELEKLYKGNTITWKNLENGNEGKSIHLQDNTFFRLAGTWKVTDDGFRCQTNKKGEKCCKVLKNNEKYLGVDKNGNEIFEFTSSKLTDGAIVTISPEDGDYLSSKEVQQLLSGNAWNWKLLKQNKTGKVAYYPDGTWAFMGGSWRTTKDGLHCKKWDHNNKEYCGKVFKVDGNYYISNEDGTKATIQIAVAQ